MCFVGCQEALHSTLSGRSLDRCQKNISSGRAGCALCVALVATTKPYRPAFGHRILSTRQQRLELSCVAFLIPRARQNASPPRICSLTSPCCCCFCAPLQADFELKEITHCRLAMLAFSGMVTQAVLYNGGFPYTG